jgi:hypothetical protein
MAIPLHFIGASGPGLVGLFALLPRFIGIDLDFTKGRGVGLLAC